LKEILLNNAWPLWTENLRGARERQVRFIFVSDPAFFEETLKQSGWVKRDVYVHSAGAGVILKSSGGTCARVTVANTTGAVTSTVVACP
jgi:hypothetical protein